MKWSGVCDLGASESSRRAASYLRALWRMGYVDLLPAAGGPPSVRMTARGLKILTHVTSHGEGTGICEVCGARVDSFHRDRIERTLGAFEKDYGIEVSITFCCTGCLVLPEHLLRRLAAFLRRWYSSGRPRAISTESWVVEDMEITGFLDSRYRPAQLYLDVQPRKGALLAAAEEEEEAAEGEAAGEPVQEIGVAADGATAGETAPEIEIAAGAATAGEPVQGLEMAAGAAAVGERALELELASGTPTVDDGAQELEIAGTTTAGALLAATSSSEFRRD